MRVSTRRFAAVIGAAALSLGVLAGPAHAATAALGGRITDEATGAPIAACVTIYTAADFGYVTSTCASDAGDWSAPDLEAGVAYKVQVGGSGPFIGEWYDNAQTFDSASPVTAPATIDTALQRGAEVRGRLTDTSGAPVSSAYVDVVDAQTWQEVGFASTDSDGTWSTLVRPGQVKVHFSAWPADQWAFGKDSFDTADPVTATTDQPVQVDDRIVPQGTISGRVTDAVTHAPVEGVCVAAVLPSLPADESPGLGSDCTAADGTYQVQPWEAGAWVLSFQDPQGRYVQQYSGGTRVLADATTYEVHRGSTGTSDAALAVAGHLSGSVVDSRTGAPIADVCPAAYAGRAGGFVVGQAQGCTDAHGAWTLGGLPAGSVAVHVAPPGSGSLYNVVGDWLYKSDTQAGATLVEVRQGATTATRTERLVPGGTLSGTITDQFGQPVEGVWVDASGVLPGRAGPGNGMYDAMTDAQGRYAIQGLPAGSYTPVVYSGSFDQDYAPVWSGKADSLAAAQPLKVKTLKTTGFDAQVLPGARITGSVVTADGSAPQEYGTGFVYSTSGAYLGDFDSMPGSGEFRTTPLPPGDYVLRLDLSDSGRTVWFDGAPTQAAATVVHLDRGEQRAVTFHVP